MAMKKLYLFICLLVIMALLAACGGGTDDTDDDTTAQDAGQTQQTTPPPTGDDGIDWGEHVTFTWFINNTPANDYFTSYNDEPVANYLMHRFNVTFDFQNPPVGTEADALALMFGSGRFTDAINLSVYTGNVAQLYDDNIIVDIAQWLDYMPNFRHLLETNPAFSRAAYDDLGRILMLPNISDEPQYPFSGLMYRHDILETMTDGNVQFPSGNDAPTTIEDWEYMLPMFLEYFQNAGFADFAPLILPPNGIIHFGQLMNSFGAHYDFYVRDGIVYSGILEPAFYDYISTMRTWFENGWIHQDFAARVGDMFFMPNPPLVFGGVAGAWNGMIMHLGDRMSMPEFGMEFDVRPIASPMGEGITHRDMLRSRPDEFGMAPRSNAVSTSNPDIGRFLAALDHLYSEEGALLKAFGLRADQIPPGYTMMDTMGMSEGTYWFDESGNLVIHPNLDIAGGHITFSAVNGTRFNGRIAESHINALRDEETVRAHAAWTAQCDVSEVFLLPNQLTPTVAEAAILTANAAQFADLRDQMLVRFIVGTDPLNEATWNEFLDQLRAFGIEENRDIWQAAYDRFLVRGQ